MTGALALLREILGTCTEAERKAAEFVLADPAAAALYTVAELARRADTSPPAVVRLCHKAGLSGYRELQLLLARDLCAPGGPPGSCPDPSPSSIGSVSALAADAVDRAKGALERVLALLKPEAYESAAATLSRARSAAAFGTGSSSLVAYDLAQKLARAGIPCSFSFDADMQVASACGLRSDDVAVAVSYSGHTGPVLRAVEEAKRSGARVIAVTVQGSSPLVRLADALLPIPAIEAGFHPGTPLSRITQTLVIDILYAVLLARDSARTLPLVERSMAAARERSGDR
ncbi:MAG: MurR/RpiR family transcriptional regulator [Spirochaetia bacterium]|nr:MurR/RpiR family transcriptional regulator [Spirochaetia bacterium]